MVTLGTSTHPAAADPFARVGGVATIVLETADNQGHVLRLTP